MAELLPYKGEVDVGGNQMACQGMLERVRMALFGTQPRFGRESPKQAKKLRAVNLATLLASE